MSPNRWITACGTVALVCGLSAAAFAVEFSPFTDVESVCADCEQPAADELTLTSGETVRGKVVAENDDFFVVVRYGEVRAVPRDGVETISWADGARPSDIGDKDQLVLESGHVLSGTIVDEQDEPAHFRLESSFADFTYTVFKEEVATAYKDGSEYRFTIPERDED